MVLTAIPTRRERGIVMLEPSGSLQEQLGSFVTFQDRIEYTYRVEKGEHLTGCRETFSNTLAKIHCQPGANARRLLRQNSWYLKSMFELAGQISRDPLASGSSRKMTQSLFQQPARPKRRSVARLIVCQITGADCMDFPTIIAPLFPRN